MENNNSNFTRRTSTKPTNPPQHSMNTRAQGDALCDLPAAAYSAPLLGTHDQHIRSYNSDGRYNVNARYLSLSPPIQGRRKVLVASINVLLGDNMDHWHLALHRPQGLPLNALDWSTVVLQQTYDLARSMPKICTIIQRLEAVHYAMELTVSVPGLPGLMKAALYLRVVGAYSPKDSEIYQLKDQVESLQELLDEAQTELIVQQKLHELENQQHELENRQLAAALRAHEQGMGSVEERSWEMGNLASSQKNAEDLSAKLGEQDAVIKRLVAVVSEREGQLQLALKTIARLRLRLGTSSG